MRSCKGGSWSKNQFHTRITTSRTILKASLMLWSNWAMVIELSTWKTRLWGHTKVQS